MIKNRVCLLKKQWTVFRDTNVNVTTVFGQNPGAGPVNYK